MPSHPLRPPTDEELLRELALSGDPQLRDRIIERQEPLVRLLARKFVRTGVSLDDLVQVAWVALIQAVDRFDPEHGTKFNTYAFRCMAGAIRRYFRDTTWSFRAPRSLQDIATGLRQKEEALIARLGRRPTVEEMAAAFGVTDEEILQAMELYQNYQPQSLDDAGIDGNGAEAQSLMEMLGQPDEAIEQVTERLAFQQMLGCLDVRNRHVLRRRFVDGWTQLKVAEELGISQFHVSRLERQALLTVRQSLPTV